MEQKPQEKNRQLEVQNEELRLINKELMAQQQELIEKIKELEKVNQAKSELLASMSHELRTPLNTIIGFSVLMLDGVTGEINNEQRECLSDIQNSGRQLLDLINDALDLSKIEAGRMEFRLAALNLANVINDTVQTVRPMLRDNRHKLRVSIEEPLPQVLADEKKLRQIFLNLLSNAIRFTQAGGELGIEARSQGDWCQISVVDNGVGIRKEDQERIFEPFTQVEASPERKNGGTGLGLTLTKRFVEGCGGKIWLESEYGRGSKFTFNLLLEREGEPHPEEKEEHPAQRRIR